MRKNNLIIKFLALICFSSCLGLLAGESILLENVLDPEFFWMLRKKAKSLAHNHKIYQNFLAMLGEKLITKHWLKGESGKQALLMLQESWGLNKQLISVPFLAEFCRLLSSIHPKECQFKDCTFCRRNVTFLLGHQAALKNLLYATAFKQKYGSKRRVKAMLVFCSLTILLPLSIIGALVWLCWRYPAKVQEFRAQFSAVQPPSCPSIREAEVIRDVQQRLGAALGTLQAGVTAAGAQVGRVQDGCQHAIERARALTQAIEQCRGELQRCGLTQEQIRARVEAVLASIPLTAGHH